MAAAEQKKQARTWSMGTSTTSRSFALESWSYVQHKDYTLHLLQKDKTGNKVTIPATEAERLAFFRGYSSSPFKTQIVYMNLMQYSGHFWLYVQNFLFKSLPVHYLHVFLAAYNPDAPLFAAKMAPLGTGVSWQVLLCGVLQLVCSMDVLSLYLHYNVFGIISKTPWDMCHSEKFYIKPNPHLCYCFEKTKFINVTEYNKKHNLHDFYLVANFWHGKHPDTNESIYFQTAPIVYFLHRWTETSVLMYKSHKWITYFIILWMTPALCYKGIFRRHTWKIFNGVQLFLNIFFLCSALFIFLSKFEDEETFQYPNIYIGHDLETLEGFDFSQLAETIHGPPVVQLLTARSSDQIQPGRDSILIVFSNAFYYVFKSVVNDQIKKHVEAEYKFYVMVSWFNHYPDFYVWNMFFADVFLGTVILKIYYLSSFVVEFLIFMITFQIIIEVIVVEWHMVKRWIASLVLPIIGIALSTILSNEEKRYLYVFTTEISCAAELAVVCWLYPLSRLFDDMNFHFGSKPMAWRKISLACMPFYTMYKLYRLIATYSEAVEKMDYLKVNNSTLYEQARMNINWNYTSAKWTWVVAVAPLVIGFAFGIIKHIFMQKQTWRELMKPRADWGPNDHVIRQLRKQFDAREYVGSQASRYLSRHLLEKAHTKTYRLDVKYGTEGERVSTIIAAAAKQAAEKIPERIETE